MGRKSKKQTAKPRGSYGGEVVRRRVVTDIARPDTWIEIAPDAPPGAAHEALAAHYAQQRAARDATEIPVS